MGYSEGRVNKHRMVYDLMRISVPLFFAIGRTPLRKAPAARALVLATAFSLLIGMAGMAAEGRGTAINAQGSAARMAAAAGSIADHAEPLGESTNLRWEDTTVLRWDAVENADRYLVQLLVTGGGSNNYEDDAGAAWLASLQDAQSASSSRTFFYPQSGFLNKYVVTVSVDGKTSIDLEDDICAVITADKASLMGTAYTVSASVQAISTDKARYLDGPAVQGPSFRYLRTTYEEAANKNGWFFVDGNWYFYSAGVRQTGWITFLDKQYYLDRDGKMAGNRWVGKKYLKASGEMARNEWVDGGRFYVDGRGNKAAFAVFSMKNWHKGDDGWFFKKNDGSLYTNTWKVIMGRTYYFDDEGYVRTGWFDKDGETYYMSDAGDIASGYGAMCTGWQEIGEYTYWFDDDGEMATDRWVDKNQYYVDSDGHKLDWITYGSLRNVGTANRLGFYVYDGGSAPEQSIAGYEAAYENGNRVMVADLRFTKDGVPVCFHDDEVRYAREKDGKTPSELPEVSRLTLSELEEYDYGIYRGWQYRGTAPLTLNEMARWVGSHADAEVYIEIKTDENTTQQLTDVAEILAKYGILDRSSVIFTIWDGADSRSAIMHRIVPSLRIGITSSFVNGDVINQIERCKGADNEVFMWCRSSMPLTDAVVDKIRSLDVAFECGTYADFETLDDIISYYSSGPAYGYCSGIETPGFVFQTELRAATCHNAAKWEDAEGGRMYLQIDGTYARSKWLMIDGRGYYFNDSGIMTRSVG